MPGGDEKLRQGFRHYWVWTAWFKSCSNGASVRHGCCCTRSSKYELPDGVKKVDCLTTLLKESDIISLHVHLSDKTRHMIGAEQFNLMKQGAVIINTARGAIVNSSALLDALNSEKISAAAVDVLENEHEINSKSHPLIDYAKANENLIITPHMGGATFEAVEKTDQFIINRYLQSLRRKMKQKASMCCQFSAC